MPDSMFDRQHSAMFDAPAVMLPDLLLQFSKTSKLLARCLDASGKADF